MFTLTQWLPRYHRRTVGKASRPRFRPAVEMLEDRVVPAGVLTGTDPILEWNAVAIEADRVSHSGAPGINNDQGGPVRSARALAMTHAAMFDAFNSIDGSFTQYLVTAPSFLTDGASIDAAVAQAARDVLVTLYPSQASAFNSALFQTLARVPDGAVEDRGRLVGRFVSDAVLAARANDGSDSQTPHTETLAPGFFRTFVVTEPAALGPQWGAVTPFVIDDVNNFQASDRVGRTIEERLAFLNSQEYTQAYVEVYSLGSDGVSAPTQRTQGQTYIGEYWAYDGSIGLGTPPRLYNQIVRTIAAQQNNTVAENARLFALVNLSLGDAGIAAWGAKYDDTIGFDFWRPIRGVRQLDPDGLPVDDGNPFTQADPNWTPLGAPRTGGVAPATDFTPPFPAYTSGHATFGAAVFKVLANFYQTDDINFSFTSDELNGFSRGVEGDLRPLLPRTFTSLSEAAAENAASRIFLGIHWRFDGTEGIRVGNGVADFIFENALRPVGGGSPSAFDIPIGRYDALVDAYLRLGYRGDVSDFGVPEPPFPSGPVGNPLMYAADAVSAAAAAVPTTAPDAAQEIAGRLAEIANGGQLNALIEGDVSQGRKERIVERLTTRITRLADRLETIADRVGRRADNASGSNQQELREVETRLRDLIAASRDLVERLGELA